MLLLTACEGIFEGIYDNDKAGIPEQATLNAVEGKLYVDASDWSKWYYIDLKALHDSIEAHTTAEGTSSYSYEPTAFNIPQETTGEDSHPYGIYTYWYDVFGLGLANHEYRSYRPTAPQPEPTSWTLAVHRNNVRTNGGAAYETEYTSLDQLPEGGSSAFAGKPFSEDEWNELDVWTVQNQMLLGLIGNQGIKVNNVLSSWLRVSIPPMPPTFALNSHVFILRLADGTCAALQLENYRSPSGTTCCLTIRYKYPL